MTLTAFLRKVLYLVLTIQTLLSCGELASANKFQTKNVTTSERVTEVTLMTLNTFSSWTALLRSLSQNEIALKLLFKHIVSTVQYSFCTLWGKQSIWILYLDKQSENLLMMLRSLRWIWAKFGLMWPEAKFLLGNENIKFRTENMVILHSERHQMV